MSPNRTGPFGWLSTRDLVGELRQRGVPCHSRICGERLTALDFLLRSAEAYLERPTEENEARLRRALREPKPFMPR